MSRLLFAAVAVLITSVTPVANPNYFSNVREVTVADASRQNYIAADQEIWEHSQPDLADLRLYAHETEVPYYLTADQAQAELSEVHAKLLQLGTKAGGPDFFVETTGTDEFNRITLELKTRNFVAKAQVSGMDDIHQIDITDLGTYTLYDFTREVLGSNFTLKIPASRFRYLHVHLSNEVPVADVQGATVAYWQEKKAGFTLISGAVPQVVQNGKKSEFFWKSSKAVPLERISFTTPEINFLRNVQVEDAEGHQVAQGQISRIRMVRNGKQVQFENLEVMVSSRHANGYRVLVDNGDDPPLRQLVMQSWFITRRIYFDPRGNSAFKLYYGDPKLNSPVYDYAKLFQLDPAAAPAQLGDGAHNAEYTGRPDDRPWSEKHPAVLWIAMLVAVAGLGVVALRGLKGNV